MTTRSRTLAIAASALFLGTIVSFWPVQRNPFIFFDDPVYITNNPHVRTGLTASGVAWALTATETSNWHPATWVAHMLDVTFFGLNPAGHHATSLALHAATAVLLFGALAGMTGRPWLSLCAAALFALHPLRVESVAWASEKKDVLAGLFWMLTMALHARYARKPGFGRYAAVLVVFALGLAAKSMLVTLPFALLLLDWWPLGRFAAGARGSARPAAGPLARLVLEKLPHLTLALGAGALTWHAQRTSGAVWDLGEIPLVPRLLNAAVSAVRYLEKTLWPVDLSPLYPHPGPNIPLAAAFAASGALVVATLVVVRRRAEHPWLLFGWLWFLGTLAPVIGIVQVGWQGMADRYTYIPLVGPVIALVWTIGLVAVPRRRLAVPAACAACGAFILLGALTWRQTTVWRDGVSVFSRAVATTGENFAAEYLLGTALRIARRPDEAERHLREATRINPRFGEPYHELGRVAFERGDLAAAVHWYEQALPLMPAAAAVQLDLAEALERLGDPAGALRGYLAAATLDPAAAQAHIGAAMLLDRFGRADEAAEHIRQASAAILKSSGPRARR